ncbi:hypothetical protein NO042_450096 [Flavobacterium psychrophilum]|nr:hypothetical protein NO042_450096 [Flavobacterium psychrophilum]SNB96769.1 hypothetical protein FPC840_2650003 [Flavobacterium psychrophilum]
MAWELSVIHFPAFRFNLAKKNGEDFHFNRGYQRYYGISVKFRAIFLSKIISYIWFFLIQ